MSELRTARELGADPLPDLPEPAAGVVCRYSRGNLRCDLRRVSRRRECLLILIRGSLHLHNHAIHSQGVSRSSLQIRDGFVQVSLRF